MFNVNTAPVGTRVLGVLFGVVGDVVFILSVMTMSDSWRAGVPENEKTELITNGIYQYSRNPAFLGFDLMYIGVMLMFSNPVLIAFTVLAVVSLHLQIMQEEKYLAARFGEQYTAYKNHVFRYLGRK